MNNYIVYKHITPNGKVYIGITSRKSYERWCGGGGYRTQILFYRAIQKYGWKNIKHKILYTNLTKEEAEQKEIELIAKYKSNNPKYGYNVEKGGNATGKISDETKLKISKASKGKIVKEETKKKISINNARYWKNKKRDIKTIEKLRQANIGKHHSVKTEFKKGNVVSKEIREKISQALSKPVICVETNVEYYGIREASRQTGINCSRINLVCRGRFETAGGLHWKYKEENDGYNK